MCTTTKNSSNSNSAVHGSASIVNANTAQPMKRFPMRQEEFNALAKLAGNDACIDCGSGKEVEWASVSFGILFCARCSEVHKQVVGAHFRCIKEGSPWTRDNLNRMKLGGNDRFRSYLDEQGIKFAKASMQERYTCKAAKDYYLELKALVDEAKAFVTNAAALQAPAVEGALEDMVTPRVSDLSMDDSLTINDIAEGMDESMPHHILKSLEGSNGRRRSDTEDTYTTEDSSNHVITEESEHDAEEGEGEEEEVIVKRLSARHSITSLDLDVSKCVRQCLDENKEEQSILYKWTSSKFVPTVTYMGRSIRIEDDYDAAQDECSKDSKPPAVPTAPSEASLSPMNTGRRPSIKIPLDAISRMGFSWRTDSTDDMEDEDEDYQQNLRDLSHEEFSTLKEALRSKGALTSKCVEEMLYTVASSSCHLPAPRRSSFKSSLALPLMSDRSRSRWAPPPHHTSSVVAEGEGGAEGDEEEMPAIITISRAI